MKFTCQREKLLAAFQVAATVVPSRSPKVVLCGVKLVASEQRTTLLATDMEVGIRVDVADIELETPGAVMLPVERVGAILRESRDEKLLIETTDDGTVMQGERSQFVLQGEDPQTFPSVLEFQDENYHELSARLFHQLIRRTSFATDVDSSRYALGGVLLEFHPEQIIAVGTDGRRLAKMEGAASTVGQVASSDAATIVPAKAMQLMERAFPADDDTIKIAVHPNGLIVSNNSVTISSRLVEGRFPKWRDVFPQQREARQINLPVGPFHSAVRQVAVVVTKESRGVDFTFGDGTLELSASTAEVGHANIRMPIADDGSPITLSLDPRYVADFLKVLDAETTVVFEIENSEAAALLTTDDGFGYVVMPMARTP